MNWILIMFVLTGDGSLPVQIPMETQELCISAANKISPQFDNFRTVKVICVQSKYSSK